MGARAVAGHLWMPAGIGSLFHGTVPAAVDFTGSIVMARSGHVVCATDLSEASHAAVTVAIRLAQQRDARLHLLHVVENPFHQPWLTGAEGLDFAELLRNRIQSAEYQLGILAVTLTSVTLPPISTVVIGRPADEIVRYAQDYDADLIVIATRGYGGMKRVLLGSIANRVMRQATCPVLIVPPHSMEAASPTTPVTVGRLSRGGLARHRRAAEAGSEGRTGPDPRNHTTMRLIVAGTCRHEILIHRAALRGHNGSNRG
jgi:nucleotide-binding universal stress UspA family protein